MEENDIAITDNPVRVVIDLIKNNWDLFSILKDPAVGHPEDIHMQSPRVMTTATNYVYVDEEDIDYDEANLFESEYNHQYGIKIQIVTRTRAKLIAYWKDLSSMLNILSNRPHTSLVWPVLYFRNLEDKSHEMINRFAFNLTYEMVSYTRPKPA
jgi:hypothetical protein